MFKKFFSAETKPDAFFRRIDWTAFWAATTITFLVYLFTLGPSVGLEDSGELATAGDHLGVPHPPGYPFWTMCSYFFCRLFSWVTYRGQPTPAFAISLLSAVFGAFAAGCSAMLITRSASDMMKDAASDEASSSGHRDLLALAGGLGGSLVFAFSPVEWSQSTIVEIYSLNALFLMWVFLLSYRWMRKPSDKILWLTAFVFGLGLTNYQVLLLAAVPLAIIILLRDIKLFRDFLLIGIPVGLTAIILKVGCLLRANQMMGADVINKFVPVQSTDACPNSWVLGIGCGLLALAAIAGAWLRAREDRGAAAPGTARNAAVGLGFGGATLIFLAATIFASKETWAGEAALVAPLLEPKIYAFLGSLLAAAVACGLGAAFAPKDAKLSSAAVWPWLAGAAVCAFVTISYVANLPTADAAGYAGTPFAWGGPTLILVAGVLALFALAAFTPRGLAYAVPVATVQVVVFILLRKGAMNGLTLPQSWWFCWPIVWNFVVLGLAWAALPNGRAVALTAFFAELGVSFYAYMPIVSDLRNPPMNWGYPRTWEGFKHAILRGQYEAIQMTPIFSKEFVQQLSYYFTDLRMQFTLVAATLALLPFTFWRVRAGAKRVFHAVYLGALLYLVIAGFVIASETYHGEPPGRVDKYLTVVLGMLVLVGLGTIVVRQVVVFFRNLFPRKADDAAPVEEPSVSFGMDDISQQWLLASGACFAVMSILLVALAQVKGDIQDGFIQKVKFISSHAIFSMWIGYGLAIGLVVANRLMTSLVKNTALRHVLLGFCLVCASLTCLIPIYENYTNEHLVFAMGSAEQNGHTFGWQFGNYQLRGANAINEELAPDEEPLPNPSWPEEMEPSSIFFGGTDPGRFVPTYMIYSADVRPDVYLITQNALADDTYMSVERDLYGDDIWIPAKEDSAESFNIYVNEVKSGKRPANADLRIENGRVQVTGALGVMEINGILTKMMFDHERLRHAFYVEESYVIQWMYPYLTPHGLIMKINKDPGQLTAAVEREDMEFWDWYTRRLLRDPAFRRDFPAQKSFSKLRAAIAGLYARQGRVASAARAFQESCHLYPASPEATFRYCQEVLLNLRRWDAILDILDYTDVLDPNNHRTDSFRGYVTRLRQLTDEITALQRKSMTGKLSNRESVILARDLLEVGQNGLAAHAAREAIADKDLKDFEILFTAARLLAQAGQRGDAANAMLRAKRAMPPNIDAAIQHDVGAVLADGGLNDEAADSFNTYLRVHPEDVEAWLTFAIVEDALGQTAAAQGAIMQAAQRDQAKTIKLIQGNAALQRIAAPLFRRAAEPQPAPTTLGGGLAPFGARR